MSPYQRGSDRVGRAVSRPTARRQGNRIFYVASEGERTEIDYLGRLDAAYGPRLNFLIRMPPRSTQHDGLSPSQVVEDAARAADDVDIYEAWGLFDHDGRPDIDQVCASALRQRVRVALAPSLVRVVAAFALSGLLARSSGRRQRHRHGEAPCRSRRVRGLWQERQAHYYT